MDQVLDYNNFEVLTNVFKDNQLRQSVRLLCVFGCGAGEAIYATNEDKVFGFGRNRFGGLGLGTVDEHILNPTLNHTLSDRQLLNIFCGFEHWIGLTASGQCYAWGHNQFGQLGIGTIEPNPTPQLVKGLKNIKVVDMSCGGFYSLALTSDGQVYGWGHNQFGQLGDGRTETITIPKHIPIDEKIRSLSCGIKHTIALTLTGRALVWGLNSYGQLGREVRRPSFLTKPEPIPGFEDTVFAKVVCGPNHSILLTSDGYVYTLGDNKGGQIGNGSMEPQSTPFRVSDDLKFKDIIGNKENDVSIAVSMDNRVFVWGLAKNRRYLTPQDITSGDSVFDIYAKVTKTGVTFKTVVIDSKLKTWELIDEELRQQTIDRKDTKFGEKISTSPKSIETSKHSSNSKSDENKRTIEDFLNIDDLNYYDLNRLQLKTIQSIRLFYCFQRGKSVIYSTKGEDMVYGMGFNRNGCLGLGYNNEYVHKPELNQTLSGKHLIDIVCGYQHCIGLTSSGECYAWGNNKYGQLGIGSDESQDTPQKIEEFSDKTIVQISCGAYHSMAVTSDGELFSWGHNTFAQLGDKTYNSRNIPTQVLIRDRIITISCGTNHSMALSSDGKAYVWGCNESGQLGRPKEMDYRETRLKACSNRPKKIPGFDGKVITKAVCGSHYSVLLTSDGIVYAFGDNINGQMANGTTDTQFTPFALKLDKIKDIVTHWENDLLVAVSDDNRIFVWGLVNKKKVLFPQPIPESKRKSLFDIYVKLANEKVTYRTLNVFEGTIFTKDFDQNLNKLNKTQNNNNESIEDFNGLNINSNQNSSKSLNNFEENSELNSNTEQNIELMPDFTQTSNGNQNCDPFSGEVFLKHLNHCFNNPNKSDLKICSEDKVIYCNKTVLKIRNDFFWQILSQRLSDDFNNEIHINPKTYESFYAFIQYIYGMTPEISVEFITDLQKMAKHFGEPELEDLCADYCRQLRDSINILNVCAFYQMAINRGLTALETDCIEFVSKNTKNFFKSEAFQAMDDSLSKRLMNAIIKQNN